MSDPLNLDIKLAPQPLPTPLAEREAAFLKDYEEVVRKHNICVTGCGCCDSPFLVAIDDHEVERIEGHIKHLCNK